MYPNLYDHITCAWLSLAIAPKFFSTSIALARECHFCLSVFQNVAISTKRTAAA